MKLAESLRQSVFNNPPDAGRSSVYADCIEELGAEATPAELNRLALIRFQCGQPNKTLPKAMYLTARQFLSEDVAEHIRRHPEVDLFNGEHPNIAVLRDGFWRIETTSQEKVSQLLSLKETKPTHIVAMPWYNFSTQHDTPPGAAALVLSNRDLHANHAKAIVAMAKWPHMPAGLDLSNNFLHLDKATGIKAIGHWPQIPAILSLSDNHISSNDAAAVTAMAKWPQMPAVLDLSDNDLSYNNAAGIKAMGEWPQMPAVLNLSRNVLFGNDALAIACMGKWPQMPTKLDLSSNNQCNINTVAAGIKAMATWKHMPAILDLSGNDLYYNNAAGIKVMGQWQRMPKTLNLSYNLLFDERGKAMAHIGTWLHMPTKLDLSDNRSSYINISTSIQTIATWRHMPATLVMCDNDIRLQDCEPIIDAIKKGRWKDELKEILTGNPEADKALSAAISAAQRIGPPAASARRR